MLGRVIALGVAIALGGGCDCEPKRASENLELPAGFEKVMQEHGALSVVARNALIRGELPLAQQSMRKLAFFMEHVPFPEEGKEYARITRELATEVREAADLEEASMAFARLSNACGQCHHALDRGPPMKLDPSPEGEELKMHMRRHFWAVERMWEALLQRLDLGVPGRRRNAGGVAATRADRPEQREASWHDPPRLRGSRPGVRSGCRRQGP